MSVYRPGGTELTEYAFASLKIGPRSRVLDIGCGDGTAAAFLKDRLGMDVVAIDIDPAAVKKAKEKGVDARVMDASMLGFDIREFDVVMMECVFTELKRQEEAIHEAYCVLKKGGVLILSDLYCREPDTQRWQEDYRSAMAQFRRPRTEGDCEKEEDIPSPYMQDGGVVLEGLTDLLEELEMEILSVEDRTADLRAFAAQAVMDHGSVQKWFEAEGVWKPCYDVNRNIGYFLMTARKP